MRKRLPIIYLLLSSLLLPVMARSADLEIRAEGEYVMGAAGEGGPHLVLEQQNGYV